MEYVLDYQQPYERDYDSGPGIGDHVIEHANQQVRFQAGSEKDARLTVKQFLSEGSIVFNHYLDGDGKTYTRKLVRLTKVKVLEERRD